MTHETMAGSETRSAAAPAAALAERFEAEVEARLAGRMAEIEERLGALERRAVSNKATLVVFSGDLDKVLAALVIASGAAAMGLEVTIFHTFWGLAPLRRGRKLQGKGWLEKALAVAVPAGPGELVPSRLAFAGAGARLFRARLADKGVQTPEELLALARELGVRFLACEMSMEVLGFGRDELIEGVEVAGVGAFLGEAAESKVTLFI